MPSMSKRSLIKFGQNGLAITIPKAWADYYELKPGDKLQVIRLNIDSEPGQTF